ncbi:S46 family peptidase [Xanthomonas citri pv. glycines]|nr:S46 family peptidase [Xanthomonas citri pv. glycines]TSK02160.1 S46 family peptidase [Xanthomonas citri pv. glycines]
MHRQLRLAAGSGRHQPPLCLWRDPAQLHRAKEPDQGRVQRRTPCRRAQRRSQCAHLRARCDYRRHGAGKGRDGNSGSPVMDAQGKLVGLAFDGNWESVSSN